MYFSCNCFGIYLNQRPDRLFILPERYSHPRSTTRISVSLSHLLGSAPESAEHASPQTLTNTLILFSSQHENSLQRRPHWSNPHPTPTNRHPHPHPVLRLCLLGLGTVLFRLRMRRRQARNHHRADSDRLHRLTHEQGRCSPNPERCPVLQWLRV